MDEVKITVIGSGVIGLAVAYEFSRSGQDVLVVEKNHSFGQEISSRNSEVIHSGIYYPKDSLKAKTCIEGKALLYEFCRNHSIPHKKIGKLIVAIRDDEIKEMEALFKNGKESGAEELYLLFEQETKKIEPNIKAKAAIYSASTGILDTHAFMKCLVEQIKSYAGQIAFNTEVIAIDKLEDGFRVCVQDNKKEEFNFYTKTIINCAGLGSEKIASLAGLNKKEYHLKYCKGDYFRVHNNKARFIQRLIYPVPKKDRAGLGIHATLDLATGLRLGPDDEYVEKIDYAVDGRKRKIFYESVRTFLPFIKEKDLCPDTSGIRPKLQGPGEDFRDFIIEDESVNGVPGLFNLIGIESPGFTASLAIAKLLSNKFDKKGI